MGFMLFFYFIFQSDEAQRQIVTIRTAMAIEIVFKRK